MTDEELTELAAKATPGAIYKFYWNPLANDSDALRLAIDLQMQVEYLDFTGNARARTRHNEEWAVEYCMSKDFTTKDPYAATRRAIVRAAASSVGNG